MLSSGLAKEALKKAKKEEVGFEFFVSFMTLFGSYVVPSKVR